MLVYQRVSPQQTTHMEITVTCPWQGSRVGFCGLQCRFFRNTTCDQGMKWVSGCHQLEPNPPCWSSAVCPIMKPFVFLAPISYGTEVQGLHWLLYIIYIYITIWYALLTKCQGASRIHYMNPFPQKNDCHPPRLNQSQIDLRALD